MCLQDALIPIKDLGHGSYKRTSWDRNSPPINKMRRPIFLIVGGSLQNKFGHVRNRAFSPRNQNPDDAVVQGRGSGKVFTTTIGICFNNLLYIFSYRRHSLKNINRF